MQMCSARAICRNRNIRRIKFSIQQKKLIVLVYWYYFRNVFKPKRIFCASLPQLEATQDGRRVGCLVCFFYLLQNGIKKIKCHSASITLIISLYFEFSNDEIQLMKQWYPISAPFFTKFGMKCTHALKEQHTDSSMVVFFRSQNFSFYPEMSKINSPSLHQNNNGWMYTNYRLASNLIHTKINYFNFVPIW